MRNPCSISKIEFWVVLLRLNFILRFNDIIQINTVYNIYSYFGCVRSIQIYIYFFNLVLPINDLHQKLDEEQQFL